MIDKYRIVRNENSPKAKEIWENIDRIASQVPDHIKKKYQETKININDFKPPRTNPENFS